jgi:TonB family protein
VSAILTSTFAGVRFVAALRDRGGWALVDKVMRDPPATTAEISDPDRYFHPLPSVSFDAISLAPGFRLIREGAIGEGMAMAMAGMLGMNELPVSLFTGWRADHSWLVEGPGGRALLVMTEWKSAAEAQAFADGVRDWRDRVSRASEAPTTIMLAVARGERVAWSVLYTPGLQHDPSAITKMIDFPPAPIASSSAAPSHVAASSIPAAEEALKTTRPPRLIFGERQPNLPPALLQRLRGHKGVVMLEIMIGEDGMVDNVVVLSSTIPAVEPLLLRTVNEWRFEPPLIDGHPHRVKYLQPFTFTFN